MKTLGGSYLKFFTCKQRGKERVVWCSREIALSRQEIGFLGHQKRAREGFSLAISFQHKYIHSISAASSAQTNVESEEIQTIYSDQPKTVHVRFKLHKECAFGQQFLIVGDDPIVGLWDPSDGVPLNWSDGHVWTAEMHMPSGKVIKYKFILKGDTGYILWQPGPDRILETWDTKKTITVLEDWDNPELQSIFEEELVADLNDESLINSDLLIVAENLNQPHEESLISSDLLIVAENLNQPHEESLISSDLLIVAENLNQPHEESLINSDLLIVSENLNQPHDEGTDVIKELANANGHINQAEKPSTPMVAENITEELGEQDLSSSDRGSFLVSETNQKKEETILGNDGKAADRSNLLRSKEETRLVSDEGVPVLVPGLLPMPPEEIEAAELNQVGNNSVENTIDEIEDSSVPEETSETMIDQKQQLYGAEQLESSNILETNLQWGRRTLQKFLANLGFQ
ncbi:hypothetical protein Pfo_004435 [Paulownia fortunei]|nr:hypothetical protein Pfo_004435 [Paulownia fortunei]